MKASSLKVRKNVLNSYRCDRAFLEDLREVFYKDYKVTFSDQELTEVARNLDAFLGVFC